MRGVTLKKVSDVGEDFDYIHILDMVHVATTPQQKDGAEWFQCESISENIYVFHCQCWNVGEKPSLHIYKYKDIWNMIADEIYELEE